ncbi:uncharacterized protein B0T23DRAFT_407232 [Neurospora hispaniola]|uniref:Ubiquitin-like domain-containing protein n=1 Tax=Neurospora hispaniola TaxID=588809 RepID=A0AAJ0MNP6_9PEZI|nr:hypothetical protein B0T23DRAFT_407232 [Neurospora hispaniola]
MNWLSRRLEEGVIAPYPAGSRTSRISGSSRAINRRELDAGGSPAPTTAAGTPAGSQLRGIGGGSSVTSDDRQPLTSHPPSGATTFSHQPRQEQQEQQQPGEQREQRRRSHRRRSSQHRGDRGDDRGDRDRGRRRHSRNLSQHINKPLKRHEWTSDGTVWTRAALDRERTEFFDTRVTGRQEVWLAIHAALEILWHQEQVDAAAAAQHGDGTLAAPSDYEGEEGQGEGRGSGAEEEEEEDDDDNGREIALATAQTILNAAEITLPTGNLAQGGAYDLLGNHYSLPEHIVSDPTNISTSRPSSSMEADEDEEGYANTDTKGAVSVANEEVTEGASQEALENGGDEVCSSSERHHRGKKGKTVVNVKDLITVRVRLSDGSRDVIVQVDRGDSVRVLGRKVAENAKLSSDKKIRIAYMGKVLKETSTLPDQGWKQGTIVNALPPPQQQQQQQVAFDRFLSLQLWRVNTMPQ